MEPTLQVPHSQVTGVAFREVLCRYQLPLCMMPLPYARRNMDKDVCVPCGSRFAPSYKFLMILIEIYLTFIWNAANVHGEMRQAFVSRRFLIRLPSRPNVLPYFGDRPSTKPKILQALKNRTEDANHDILHGTFSLRSTEKYSSVDFNAKVKRVINGRAIVEVMLPTKSVEECWRYIDPIAEAKSEAPFDSPMKKRQQEESRDSAYSEDGKYKKALVDELDVLQLMAEKVLQPALTLTGLKAVGKAQIVTDLKDLKRNLQRFSPFSFCFEVDLWPEVHFVKPYTGLKLEVAKPPYPKGLLWSTTAQQLRKLHARVGEDVSNAREANWGDLVDVKVVNAFHYDEAFSEKVPGKSKAKHRSDGNAASADFSKEGDDISEFFLNVDAAKEKLIPLNDEIIQKNSVESIVMENHWNPHGLCEGILGMRAGDTKYVLVDIPIQELQGPSKTSPHSLKMPNSPVNPSEDVSLSSEQTQKHTQLDQFDNFVSEIESDLIKESYIPAILELSCLRICEREYPELNDEFFLKLCGRTEAQVRSEVEQGAVEELESRCTSTRRGAVEKALESITRINIPDCITEEKCQEVWKDRVEHKRLMGEEVDENDESAYREWKASAKAAVNHSLKLGFAIKKIKSQEKIAVDEGNILRELLLLKAQNPLLNTDKFLEKLHKVKETEAVFDWIFDHANVTYYEEERPLRINIDQPGVTNKSNELLVFPDGAVPERWRKKRQKIIEQGEKYQNMIYRKPEASKSS